MKSPLWKEFRRLIGETRWLSEAIPVALRVHALARIRGHRPAA